MTMPKQVTIVEVGPRDGLQNEAKILDTASKIKLIDLLSATGLKVIEVSSMIDPKWIPQLADAEEVYRGIQRAAGVSYPLLVPNEQGLDRALAVGADTVAVFTAASETFCYKNINCGIAESLNRFAPVIDRATAVGVRVRAYLSCAMGCPYEGEVKPEAVIRLCEQLMVMGCYEVSLGDTSGVGTPRQTHDLLSQLINEVPVERLALHFHDTHGRALDNIRTGLELGVTTVDSAINGLGGCPYAGGATGNVATESVVAMLDELGIETGIDINRLQQASGFIARQLKEVK